MALSQSSKSANRALLVIDVQNEYFTGQLPVYYPSGSLDNILGAINVALSQEIPVIVIRHTQPDENSEIFRKDSPQWQLHPEIIKRCYSLLIDKNFPGSFTDTNLEAWLRKNDINTVVISGYMTQMCCDTTARQAAHLGFSVEFLSDATGTLDFDTKAATATAEELHRSTLVAQESFFSKVMTTSEWIKEVQEYLKSDSKTTAA
ncbi:MAG: cysteine hydrolase family protein [Xenococcaceae cyanobacterium MO_167.B27]|nr:cysteine hydrolase family protein [Xenococcaceae cyanobacterium MO_167.B27]